MSTQYSPKIVTDGLVLMLDAANHKSLNGTPGVNCSRDLNSSHWTTNMTKSEITDGSIIPYRSGARIFKWVTTTVDNNYGRFSNYYNGGGFSGSATNPLILGRNSPTNFTTVGSSIGNVKYRFGFYVMSTLTMGASNCNIDIGDRNGAGVNLSTSWQFVSTTDSAGVNSDSYPYDFFDIFVTGPIGNSIYISDLMIVRSIGTIDNLPTIDSYPLFIDYEQTRGWYDLSGNKSIYDITYYGFPTYSSGYFIFVNNGTNVNQIVVTTQNLSTYNHTTYTRSAWFYQTASSGAWAPIIQNQIGNNSDLGLTINGGRLHFRQYSNTYTNGTTGGDYGVSGDLTVNTGQWYMATMCVNLQANQVTFYLNNQLDSTKTINKIGNAASDIIIIGGSSSDSYSGARMFKGYIASVSHYNRLLSADEVSQNYNATKKRFGL